MSKFETPPVVFVLEEKIADQQKKIDDLEAKLAEYENTGMIGSSPAQFMEKIQDLEERLAEAVELMKNFNKGVLQIPELSFENFIKSLEEKPSDSEGQQERGE